MNSKFKKFTHWWDYRKDCPHGLSKTLFVWWWKRSPKRYREESLWWIKYMIQYNHSWSISSKDKYRWHYEQDEIYYTKVLKYIEKISAER